MRGTEMVRYWMRSRFLLIPAVIGVTIAPTSLVGCSLDRAAPVPAARAEVTEISHRRTVCYGQCSAYSLTFRANGQAVFSGEHNVTPLGEHTGTIRREDFDRLVALADAAHFFDLQGPYDQLVTDLPYCYTRITRGAQTKEVTSRCVSLGANMPAGSPAPSALLHLEDAIDEVRRGIAWKRAEASRKKAAEQ